MSWGANRKSEPQKSKEEIAYQLRQVNAVLEKFAFDSDFTDDLKDLQVIRAIKHWTNETRLSHEEASHFQDNYRIVSVLQKINLLQNCCRQLGIAVPLEYLLGRKPALDLLFLRKCFGAEVGAAMFADISNSKEQEKHRMDPPAVRECLIPSPPPAPTAIASDPKRSSIHTDKEYVDMKSSGKENGNRGKSQAYGPSNQDEAEAAEARDVLASFFWSSSCHLADPNFSTPAFIFFTLGELFFIIMSGLIVAYVLKMLMV